MGSPAKTARLRLMAGKADPANPLSKFLMVLCKQPRGSNEVIAGEDMMKESDRLVRGRNINPVVDFEVCSTSRRNFFTTLRQMRTGRLVSAQAHVPAVSLVQN